MGKLLKVARWKILDLLLITTSAATIRAYFSTGNLIGLLTGLLACSIFSGVAAHQLWTARRRSAILCSVTGVLIVGIGLLKEIARSAEIERTTGKPIFDDGFFVSVFVVIPLLVLFYGGVAAALGFFSGWLGFKLRLFGNALSVTRNQI